MKDRSEADGIATRGLAKLSIDTIYGRDQLSTFTMLAWSQGMNNLA